MMRAPIPTSLSTKKSRLSNIFSNTSTVPCACVASTTAIEVRSAGKAGQGPSSIFGIWPPRSSRTASCCSAGTWIARVVDVDVDAEPAQDREDRIEILRHRVLDRDLASGHGGEADEARDLDVLGTDAERAAAEPFDALDPQQVRPDALDLGAER